MQDGEKAAAVPLAEEQLHVLKRPVEGRVRVRTVTDEVPGCIHEQLRGERVQIQHVAIERELTQAPDIRVEGDVTIIPVVEERLVIEKRLFLVEEVHVRRTVGIETIEQPTMLRKQRVVVERQHMSGELKED